MNQYSYYKWDNDYRNILIRKKNIWMVAFIFILICDYLYFTIFVHFGNN
jgi:hypothetical protein